MTRSTRTAGGGIARTTVALLTTVLAAATATAHAQEYRSSVVGTDFDFILDTDPDAFLCLEFQGKGLREMPDKTGPSALIQEAFIFLAHFEDGTKIDMALDAAFETEDEARAEALRLVPRLGKLPTALRGGVERVVVHQGEEDATAFSDRGLIVLYSDNATKRISTHDLEETIFHESVHASWDQAHAGSVEWRAAQEVDGGFVTRYAKNNPEGEDLAESALFAYALIHHPGRIPSAEATKIARAIPARIRYVEALLPPDDPLIVPIGPRYACDGSATTFTVAAERRRPTPDVEGPEEAAQDACGVDITRVGSLSDILSNALMLGLDQEESVVSAFLAGANDRYSNADELIDAAAIEFGFDRSTLNAQVQEFLHCNCNHVAPTDAPSGRGAPTPDEPRAAAALQNPETAEPAEVPSILYAIAALLGLLLVVNACTLAALLKRD